MESIFLSPFSPSHRASEASFLGFKCSQCLNSQQYGSGFLTKGGLTVFPSPRTKPAQNTHSIEYKRSTFLKEMYGKFEIGINIFYFTLVWYTCTTKS